MREFAALLDRRFRRRLFVDVRGLVAEFEVVIRRELDYTAEAENARRFAANFAGTQVLSPGSTSALDPQVLTEEFIEGTRFRDIRPLMLYPSSGGASPLWGQRRSSRWRGRILPRGPPPEQPAPDARRGTSPCWTSAWSAT